jgi:hypothetical protein
MKSVMICLKSDKTLHNYGMKTFRIHRTASRILGFVFIKKLFAKYSSKNMHNTLAFKIHRAMSKNDFCLHKIK